MSIEKLNFAQPFFEVLYVKDEESFFVSPLSIVFNLSKKPLMAGHAIGYLQSTVVVNFTLQEVDQCLVVADFEKNSDSGALYADIRKRWMLAWDVTHEDRHIGVQLWRSPRQMAGDFLVGMCYAGKVPLQIGLHKTHGDYPIEEVHTQVVGFGKMQECREKDLATLYREDRMSPGYTHPIMFNEQLEYPWHQFETVTEGIFMSVANHSRKPKER